MSDNEKDFIEIEKNSRENIRLSISEYKGKKLVDLRIWYYDSNEDDYKPSKKGLSISVDKYEELRDAINKFEEYI